MALTLTEQAHLFATTGTTLITNGDPLHARVMKDFPRMLNNLWAYCDLTVGYVRDPSGSKAVYAVTSSAVTETYIGQIPTIVPKGSVRLVLTAGLTAQAAASNATTVSAIGAYISATPYNGGTGGFHGDGTLAPSFDRTMLAQDYTSCSITQTVVATAATSSYSLLTTTTGVTPITSVRDAAGNQISYLVLTVTVAGSGDGFSAVNTVNVQDVTWWFLKE